MVLKNTVVVCVCVRHPDDRSSSGWLRCSFCSASEEEQDAVVCDNHKQGAKGTNARVSHTGADILFGLLGCTT